MSTAEDYDLGFSNGYMAGYLAAGKQLQKPLEQLLATVRGFQGQPIDQHLHGYGIRENDDAD